MMVCGRSNRIADSGGFTYSSFGIMMGENNQGYPTNAILIGYNNSNVNVAATNKILIGQHINVRGGQFHGIVHLGKYNDNDTFNSNNCVLTIGAGEQGDQQNALEVYGVNMPDGAKGPLVYIPHYFALKNYTTSNKARVNAITEPLDPNNLTADDQTLVTKSYVTSQSINYEPSSEVQLTAVTNYSLGTLIGDPNWSFPYSSGSITLVFTIDQVFHTVHIPIPSYLNTTIHPIIKAPLTDIHNYQITDPGDSGTLKGLLLFYKPATKEISLENPECVNIDNVGDSITDAFNYGNIDIWFWGMTCYNHF